MNNKLPLVPGAHAPIPGHLSLFTLTYFAADLYPTFSHIHELSPFSFSPFPLLSFQSVRVTIKFLKKNKYLF